MPGNSSFRSNWRPSLAFSILLVLLFVLWIAGGASRADVLGQAIVRATAWGALVLSILLLERAGTRYLGVLPYLLGAVVLLPLLQLVPLPPAVWLDIAGREIFQPALTASGTNAWRPLSVTPGATMNAIGSLVIPIAMLALMSCISEKEFSFLPGVLFWSVVASMFIGLLQFAGFAFDNPFINDSRGQVSGIFANRNHFALFLSLGCLLAPLWVFGGGRRPGWRGPVAISMIILFVLTILATGSRAGLGLGFIAIVMGALLSRKKIVQELDFYSRRVRIAFVIGAIVLVFSFIPISVILDRAIGIQRLLSTDVGQDMRSRALPTILEMTRHYFPFGAGFGSFETIFRIQEPEYLLKPTYFNHAHNDFLEIVADGGFLAVILLIWCVVWWLNAAIRAARADGERGALQRQVGGAMLLLIFVASVFDYPARTPLIMAIVVASAVWLRSAGGRALPQEAGDL